MNCSETVIQLTICGCIYMQINSLPAGGAVEAGEIEVSSVTLYTKQRSVIFFQKYSDIKTPAPGFDFEMCSAQPSILPTCQTFEFM